MGTGKLLGKPNKLRGNDLRWTSILSRESRNTPSRFMLQRPGISSGSYGPVGSKASYIFIFFLLPKFAIGQLEAMATVLIPCDFELRICPKYLEVMCIFCRTFDMYNCIDLFSDCGKATHVGKTM